MNAAARQANLSDSIPTETAIFGLGATGFSCATFLAKQGIAFSLLDTRRHPPELARLTQSMPEVPVITGELSPAQLGCCKRLILSPGVSRDLPLVHAALARGVELIGDIELFARHVRAPVLAVTGSNGKSTVVSLLAELLETTGTRVLAGGNLGIPALDLLSHPEPDYYVLELSSFQLESTNSLAPAVSCILNITPDHLDRYADIAAYSRAKQRIFQHAASVVLNRDDPQLAQLSPPCSTHYFSLRDDNTAAYSVCQRDGMLWLTAHGEALLAVDQLQLAGAHNHANALAALAISDQLGVPLDAQIRALQSFRGLPHRCHSLGFKGAVEWIDDSKGTNVGASCAAIKGVFAERGGVLIAGGQAKGASFAELAEALKERVHSVVLIGADANAIAQVLPAEIATHFALDMDAAVSTAAHLAEPGEAVLLSPGCASFDMFSDYRARGRAFSAAVEALDAA